MKTTILIAFVTVSTWCKAQRIDSTVTPMYAAGLYLQRAFINRIVGTIALTAGTLLIADAQKQLNTGSQTFKPLVILY